MNLKSKNLDHLLNLALDAAQRASEAILREQKALKICTKADGSPLSSADLASNEALCEVLASSDIAICSEESPLNYATRKDLERFWLIDPLDGTKGFIRGGDEFCILLALIEGARPILSLIAKPATGETYYAHAFSPLYKDAKPLKIAPEAYEKSRKIALLSVHHPSPLNQAFLDKNALTPLKISSALKFIALLEGRAGVYHRFESLHSWDIAAGDFLLNKNGGFMGKFSENLLKKYQNLLENSVSKFENSENSAQSFQDGKNSSENSAKILKNSAPKFENGENLDISQDDFINYNAQTFLCPHFIAVSKKEFLKGLVL